MREDFTRLNGEPTGTAAKAYFLSGLAVIPCARGEKRPVTPRGVKDAVSREGMNDAEAYSYAEGMRLVATDCCWNVAIATGHLVDVLDVDVKDGKPGLQTLRRLEMEGMLGGAVAVAVTPSGGRHVYFPASGTRSSSIAPLGLDWKASGGYVLAPPSHLAGFSTAGEQSNTSAWVSASYAWKWARPIERGAPFDWEACRRMFGIAPATPRETRPGGEDPMEVGAAVDRLAHWLSSPEAAAQRNNALYWATCRAIEAGATTELDLAPLVRASLLLSRPGERRDAEVRRTVRSARGMYGLARS